MSKSASLILFTPVVISAVPVLFLVGILGGVLVLPVAIAGSLIESASAVAVEGVSLVTGRPTQVLPVAIATEVIETPIALVSAVVDAPIALASAVMVSGVSLVTGRPMQVAAAS